LQERCKRKRTGGHAATPEGFVTTAIRGLGCAAPHIRISRTRLPTGTWRHRAVRWATHECAWRAAVEDDFG
jgi:hypothetical protein